MRVAYVCADPGVPVFGTKGASVHVQEVVRALRRAGHTVRVYAARRGEQVPPDLADLEVQEAPVPSASGALREQLQLDSASRAARQVIQDGADLVYERYSLFSTALAQAAQAGIRGVLEVNAPLVEEQRSHRVLVDEAGAWQCLRAQAKAASLTACVSEPVRRWVSQAAPESRAIVVPNGVDPGRIKPSAEDPQAVTVVFVGTLKPWHGVDDLLRAASLAQAPWRLRVIGDGPEMGSLRQQAKDLGLQVEFTGAVAPDQVPQHLAGAAIAVAPYPDLGSAQAQYFSPLKVLEYMAAGLAVVGSRVGQVPQLLDGLGALVEPSDPVGLAKAIDELATDPARRARMGQAARRAAVQRHSWDQVVGTILRAAGAAHA